MARDPVATGLRIAKRRHQLNPAGTLRAPGEPRMRQKDLAAKLGVAASTVANWERGKSYPERYLGALEAVLGISLTDEPAVQEDVYTDPDEAFIWSQTRFTPEERRVMITALREERRRGAS